MVRQLCHGGRTILVFGAPLVGATHHSATGSWHQAHSGLIDLAYTIQNFENLDLRMPNSVSNHDSYPPIDLFPTVPICIHSEHK